MAAGNERLSVPATPHAGLGKIRACRLGILHRVGLGKAPAHAAHLAGSVGHAAVREGGPVLNKHHLLACWEGTTCRNALHHVPLNIGREQSKPCTAAEACLAAHPRAALWQSP